MSLPPCRAHITSLSPMRRVSSLSLKLLRGTFQLHTKVTCSVGVSAYLGAAAAISNKDYLTAAASIVTVEARHNTFLLGANEGDPVPTAFDTPLGVNEVYTIASQFLASCPSSNPMLPFNAFTPLEVKGSAVVKPGQSLQVSMNVPDTDFAVILFGLKTTAVPLKGGWFTIPTDLMLDGQFYVVISKDGSIADNMIVAGPAILYAS